MHNRSIRTTISVESTFDNELHAHFAENKTNEVNEGLNFRINQGEVPSHAPYAQDILSAPDSEACVERVFPSVVI